MQTADQNKINPAPDQPYSHAAGCVLAADLASLSVHTIRDCVHARAEAGAAGCTTRQNVAVTLDKSRQLWRGDDFDDLAEFIRHFEAGGYPVATVVESRCAECDGRTFRVGIDEEQATRRMCLGCGAIAFIGDSADYWSEDDHDSCACPCGNEEFAVAVGFAFFNDGEVRWVSVGLRFARRASHVRFSVERRGTLVGNQPARRITVRGTTQACRATLSNDGQEI
jgi:hypothetical protein